MCQRSDASTVFIFYHLFILLHLLLLNSQHISYRFFKCALCPQTPIITNNNNNKHKFVCRLATKHTQKKQQPNRKCVCWPVISLIACSYLIWCCRTFCFIDTRFFVPDWWSHSGGGGARGTRTVHLRQLICIRVSLHCPGWRIIFIARVWRIIINLLSADWCWRNTRTTKTKRTRRSEKQSGEDEEHTLKRISDSYRSVTFY